jgi:hypothetical protein
MSIVSRTGLGPVLFAAVIPPPLRCRSILTVSIRLRAVKQARHGRLRTIVKHPAVKHPARSVTCRRSSWFPGRYAVRRVVVQKPSSVAIMPHRGNRNGRPQLWGGWPPSSGSHPWKFCAQRRETTTRHAAETSPNNCAVVREDHEASVGGGENPDRRGTRQAFAPCLCVAGFIHPICRSKAAPKGSCIPSVLFQPCGDAASIRHNSPNLRSGFRASSCGKGRFDFTGRKDKP